MKYFFTLSRNKETFNIQTSTRQTFLMLLQESKGRSYCYPPLHGSVVDIAKFFVINVNKRSLYAS